MTVEVWPRSASFFKLYIEEDCNMEAIIQQLINGLFLGSIYALLALVTPWYMESSS